MEISKINEILKKKNYSELDTRKDFLNLVGVRTVDNKLVNFFNDVIYVVVNGVIKECAATTKPGLPALLNPTNSKGTAILIPGQYKETWAIDLHNGKYKALCQRLKELTVYRDNDKDSEFDYNVATDKGFFGINIHRASAFQKLTNVGLNSAGCQVFQDPKDFEAMMSYAEKHASLYGNKFSYTLLTKEDF